MAWYSRKAKAPQPVDTTVRLRQAVALVRASFTLPLTEAGDPSAETQPPSSSPRCTAAFRRRRGATPRN